MKHVYKQVTRPLARHEGSVYVRNLTLDNQYQEKTSESQEALQGCGQRALRSSSGI